MSPDRRKGDAVQHLDVPIWRTSPPSSESLQAARFPEGLKGVSCHRGIIPDTWRSVTEPCLGISEDASQSWCRFHPRVALVADRIHSPGLRRICACKGRSRSGKAVEHPLTPGWRHVRLWKAMNVRRPVSGSIATYPIRAGTNQLNVAKLFATISPLFHDAARVKQMLANDVAFYMGYRRKKLAPSRWALFAT